MFGLRHNVTVYSLVGSLNRLSTICPIAADEISSLNKVSLTSARWTTVSGSYYKTWLERLFSARIVSMCESLVKQYHDCIVARLNRRHRLDWAFGHRVCRIQRVENAPSSANVFHKSFCEETRLRSGRTRPRLMLLAMMATKNEIHGFPCLFLGIHVLLFLWPLHGAAGAPL